MSIPDSTTAVLDGLARDNAPLHALVSMGAHMDRTPLPLSLFAPFVRALAKAGGDETDHETDARLMESFLAQAVDQGLVQVDAENQALVLSEQARQTVLSGQNRTETASWLQRAASAIDSAFPKGNVPPETWTVCQGLMPHINEIAQRMMDTDSGTAKAGRLFVRAGFYLRQRGRFEEAEAYYEQALAIFENSDEEDMEGYAACCLNLAALRVAMDQPRRADQLYLRALTMREKLYGARSPKLVGLINTLGSLYKMLGEFEKARDLFTRCLDILENSGDEASDLDQLSQCLNNLAVVHRSMGFPHKAEPLMKRALAIRLDKYGEDHPFTANTLGNLGLLYKTMERMAEAEAMYKRALEIKTAHFGAESLEAADEIHNLAALYDTLERRGRSEALYRKALAIRTDKLGPKHRDVARTLSCLAGVMDAGDFFEEAEKLSLRAVDIDRQALGPDHPELAVDLNNLASLYLAASLADKALPIATESLDIAERSLGPDHRSLVNILANLAQCHRLLEEHDRADELEARARKLAG